MTCKLISYDNPYLDDLNLAEADISRANAFIEAASAAIEKYTKRNFGQSQYDETYSADQFGGIILNQFPIITVDRVYSNTGEALEIQNTNATTTNASYYTTTTGITLTSVKVGVVSTNTFTWADYATVTSVQAAIDALADWTATVQGSYGAYATIDLLRDQYGNAKEANGVRLWLQSDNRWFVDDKDKGLIEGEFSRGGQIRFVYTAGFALKDVPEPIKQVTAELVKDMFTGGDSQIQSENLGGYSYSLAQGAVQRLPLSSREILALYKDRRV